jgi:HAD superfamily hydrolase (TIGR01509 family)
MCARKAVIFDMDGTLIDSGLDFDRIRGELGLPKVPLLEAMQDMPEERRRHCMEVLDRHEEEAARECTLAPGARETMDVLSSRGVPTALMTRNSRRSVDTILAKHKLRFQVVRTREDGEIKPSPVPVLEVCRALGVAPQEAVSVGDFQFDLQAAKAAGALAVLLVHGAKEPPFAHEADVIIYSLREVPALLDL